MFATIDNMGSGSILDGVLVGIADGWFQEALADSAYEFEKAVASGDRTIVGVNRHVNPNEPPLEVLRISEQVEAGQRTKLAALRRDRDQSRVDAALFALKEGAAADANLMSLLVDAARARATLGEIVGTMKEVFGGYTEQPRV